MDTDPFKNRVRTRSSALVIQDEKLLLVRQNAPTREDPIWLPPGGEVNFGETSKEAAEREVLEETGLHVTAGKLALIHEFIEKPFHAVELYFFAEVSGGRLQTGMDPELTDQNQQIERAVFIDLRLVPEIPVFPDFLKKTNPSFYTGSQSTPLHIISA
ncbi:MAG: NUDIX domain-containing protein [Balneolaceae bacterium]